MYKRVLAAIELAEAEATLVLGKAAELLAEEGVLCVLHVVEPQYVQYSFDPTFTGSLVKSLEQEAIASASRRVEALAAPYDIPPEHQQVVIGHPASKIHTAAQEGDFDVIVIGSHGRRGWQRLLGSTANGVLHGTPVDVFVCQAAPSSAEG